MPLGIDKNALYFIAVVTRTQWVEAVYMNMYMNNTKDMQRSILLTR